MRRLRSIRVRVTLLATLTTAVLVAGFGWWLTELVADDLVRSGETALAEITDDVEGLALVDLGEDGAEFRLDGEQVTAEIELNEEGDLRAELLGDIDGEEDLVGAFVLDTGTGEIRELIEFEGGLGPDELAEVSDQVAERIIDRAEENGVDDLDDLGESQLDVIEATQSALADVSDGVDAARGAALRIGPLLVAMSTLVTWLVVGRALAPTKRIADEAATITSDRLDRRLTLERGGEEVETIARVINEMLDRIEHGVRREQRFVADASHELKTPLATSRMAAELAAADAPDSPYPPQLVEEVDRMQQLVDDLLELARSSSDAPSASVSLGAVVEDVVAGHARSSLIVHDTDVDHEVVGRERELRRVVLNLVDNAVRHANGRVEVSTITDERGVTLTVDDDGSGVPVADRDRIFERFTRLDEGRGRDDGGSGLGLAIVRAIVDRHDGTVMVDDSPLGGARFVVTLPRPTDSP